MHTNDFREDLQPTAFQHRRIAEEFARLAGEPVPASRRAAAELLLRLERSQASEIADARAGRSSVAVAAGRAERAARGRTGPAR